MIRGSSLSMALVNGDVVPVRIPDHRHPADRRVEDFRNEHDRSFFHFLDKGIQV